MSKLYIQYLKLKQENKNHLYLFKSGIFYIFLDKDAEKINEIFQFKLTNLNKEVLKCGFPLKSLNKYMVKFKEKKLKVIIIDNKKKVETVKKYIEDVNVMAFINEIKRINIDEISPMAAYLLLKRFKVVIADE